MRRCFYNNIRAIIAVTNRCNKVNLSYLRSCHRIKANWLGNKETEDISALEDNMVNTVVDILNNTIIRHHRIRYIIHID